MTSLAAPLVRAVENAAVDSVLETDAVAGQQLAGFFATDPVAREGAWVSFTDQYSRLLLHVARSHGGDHDQVLDRYVYLLEQLKKNDFHRLRSFRWDGRTRLGTWLVVVARRLCLDHHREVYGRARRGEGIEGTEAARTRRRLADLVAEPVDAEALRCEREGPEAASRRRELESALATAVDALEPKEQLLLRLRFEDDLSGAEIARIVKLPTPFHVYRRINQILAHLRREMTHAGIEDPLP